VERLTASRVIAIWERAGDASLPDRALSLLAAAGVDGPAGLPVGERDLRLLELRERTFGPRFDAVAACPACGDRLDVAVAADDVRGAAGAGRAPETVTVESGGRSVTVRVPTGEDLVAAARAGDVAAGRAALLERCVEHGDARELDADAVDALLAEADPAARIDVALACPACAHAWTVPFDIVTILCAEVDACARSLLREVHMLASAYGWSETEVLALGGERRAAYLELLGA
jgi:hypothetical protein